MSISSATRPSESSGLAAPNDRRRRRQLPAAAAPARLWFAISPVAGSSRCSDLLRSTMSNLLPIAVRVASFRLLAHARPASRFIRSPAVVVPEPLLGPESGARRTACGCPAAHRSRTPTAQRRYQLSAAPADVPRTPPHEGDVEQARDMRAPHNTSRFELSGEGPRDPVADGRGEPAFGRPEQLAGRRVSPPLQQMLARGRHAWASAASGTRTPPAGDRAAGSAPQAVLHAHAIDLHQHVVRQVDLQVRVLRALDRDAATGSAGTAR